MSYHLAPIPPSPTNLPALAAFNLYAAVMAGRSARRGKSLGRVRSEQKTNVV